MRVSFRNSMTFLHFALALSIPVKTMASEVGLGLGVNLKQKEYKGFDTETNVLPVIYYESDCVRILGKNIDFKFYQNQNLEIAVSTELGFGDGFEESDSEFLRGMEERMDCGLGLRSIINRRSQPFISTF